MASLSTDSPLVQTIPMNTHDDAIERACQPVLDRIDRLERELTAELDAAMSASTASSSTDASSPRSFLLLCSLGVTLIIICAVLAH